jgi:hypothetical protein
VTNEIGQKIGILRSDNGGEYLSQEFEDYLKSKGIHHELAVPNSPQKNGVAEQINRTLMESARCMIAHAKLPDRYWEEAVATAAYLRNRLPTKAFKEKTTPFERWYERKPNLCHLKIFWMHGFAHIPGSQRNKMSKKTIKLRFVGYSSQSKGYRLIDDETGKVVIRRDVVFNEEDFNMNAIKEQPKQIIEVDVNSEKAGTEDIEKENAQTEEIEPENIRYPDRVRSVPVRYGVDQYISVAKCLDENQISEPANLEEAFSGVFADKWRVAADKEYQSLIQNDTWELVDLPEGRKPVGCKWVFKIKRQSDGKIERFKARVVAKGYTQLYGIDYMETFSPVVRFTSIRALLAFAVQNDMLVHQMDVVTAFLNGTLEEEIYMQQPIGYEEPGKEHRVCKLKKAIYGLKQSPRRWNTVLVEYLESIHF